MKFTIVDLNEQRVAASALTTSIYGPVFDKVKNLFYSTYVQGAIKEAGIIFASVNTPARSNQVPTTCGTSAQSAHAWTTIVDLNVQLIAEWIIEDLPIYRPAINEVVRGVAARTCSLPRLRKEPLNACLHKIGCIGVRCRWIHLRNHRPEQAAHRDVEL